MLRIGYPCINHSVHCTANSTFRLASWSKERFETTVRANLSCLMEILAFNVAHAVPFFRLSSDIIPFASHPICTIDWSNLFRKELGDIGKVIVKNRFRIAMHPDQFVVLNSPRPDVVKRSIDELVYHAALLDAMRLPIGAKIQIHIGGAYNDKEAAKQRFSETVATLPRAVARRLAIENDDKLFTVADCLDIHAATGLPVILDVFHHACMNDGRAVNEALEATGATWRKNDGPPIVDYSSQKMGGRTGTHAETIDTTDFRKFLKAVAPFDRDIMLEIKDKEKSAIKAQIIYGVGQEWKVRKKGDQGA